MRQRIASAVNVVIQVSLLAPLVPEALEWTAAEVLPNLP
mgnify:CR=1 FL=1